METSKQMQDEPLTGADGKISPDAAAKETGTSTEEAVLEAVRRAHEEAAKADSEGANAASAVGANPEKESPEQDAADGESGGNPEKNRADAGGSGENPEADQADAGEAGEDPEADQADAGKTGEEAADEMAKKTGGFFGGKDRKLKKEIEKKEAEIAEQKNSFLRLMAEFDNFRKRTEKEKSGMYAMGAKDVIEKILPVLDNFERGFSLVSEEDKEDAFVKGMEKIYRQLTTALEELGVKPIDAEGKEFDPNLHNAVMHIEDESLGENVVAKELQKGYLYKDSVVRHSMVTVAN